MLRYASCILYPIPAHTLGNTETMSVLHLFRACSSSRLSSTIGFLVTLSSPILLEVAGLLGLVQIDHCHVMDFS